MLSTTLRRKVALSWRTLVCMYSVQPPALTYICAALALQTRQLTTDSDDPVTAIDSSDFPSFSQTRMSIEIPQELVGMFSNTSGMSSNGVRLGSFLYGNVTGLFSGGLPGDNRYDT